MKEEKYKCEDCGKSYLEDGDMVNSPNTCPYCGSKNVKVVESKVSEELVQYKCKSCGKTTAIEGEEGKAVKVCPHCGSSEIEKAEPVKVSDTGESKMAEGMACYKCYSCGLLFTLTEAPSVCVYCGGKPVVRWTTESLNNKITKLSK